MDARRQNPTPHRPLRLRSNVSRHKEDVSISGFQSLFPSEFASGGGDIPQFVWHVCIENALPFEIQHTSIMVTPFLVHHGRLFTSPATLTPPSAPPAPCSAEKAEAQIAPSDVTPGIDVSQDSKQEEIIQPYMCFAFRIQEDIVYLSDCGAIPDEAWPALFPVSGRQLPVCILDCLNLRWHPSHFGLETSVAAARRIGAKRTYLIGFSHEVAHDEYVTIGEAIGGAAVAGRANLTENEVKGLEQIGEGDPIWVRPAHDGLKIQISTTEVTDETYG